MNIFLRMGVYQMFYEFGKIQGKVTKYAVKTLLYDVWKFEKTKEKSRQITNNTVMTFITTLFSQTIR